MYVINIMIILKVLRLNERDILYVKFFEIEGNNV